MSTATTAYRVVLAANYEDGARWVDELIRRQGESAQGLKVFCTRSAAHRGSRVTRIYVTPAARTGRGYHQTLAELRLSMAKTRGGDTHGPVFLEEEQ